MDTDFNALVEASRSAVNKTGVHDLWKAAIALELWYFVANGTGDDAEPIIASYEGKPHILVFTDETRAVDFSRRRSAQHASGDAPILHMEPSEAIEYFHSLREAGVEGALFNTGPTGFHTSLGSIIDMHTRYTR
jgi:hypothetical protein